MAILTVGAARQRARIHSQARLLRRHGACGGPSRRWLQRSSLVRPLPLRRGFGGGVARRHRRTQASAAPPQPPGDPAPPPRRGRRAPPSPSAARRGASWRARRRRCEARSRPFKACALRRTWQTPCPGCLLGLAQHLPCRRSLLSLQRSSSYSISGQAIAAVTHQESRAAGSSLARRVRRPRQRRAARAAAGRRRGAASGPAQGAPHAGAQRGPGSAGARRHGRRRRNDVRRPHRRQHRPSGAHRHRRDRPRRLVAGALPAGGKEGGVLVRVWLCVQVHIVMASPGRDLTRGCRPALTFLFSTGSGYWC